MAGAFRQSWTGCRCPGVECYAGAASKHPEASDVKVTSKNHRGGAPSHHLVKTLVGAPCEVPLHPSFIPEAKAGGRIFLLLSRLAAFARMTPVSTSRVLRDCQNALGNG